MAQEYNFMPIVIEEEVITWTQSYLVDRLKRHLATFELNDDKLAIFDNHKYYNQAHHMLKIGAFNPVPPFVIKLSDLTARIKHELYELDNADRNYVLHQAVGRIFDDINGDLYHNSISRILRVKLEK